MVPPRCCLSIVVLLLMSPLINWGSAHADKPQENQPKVDEVAITFLLASFEKKINDSDLTDVAGLVDNNATIQEDVQSIMSMRSYCMAVKAVKNIREEKDLVAVDVTSLVGYRTYRNPQDWFRHYTEHMETRTYYLKRVVSTPADPQSYKIVYRTPVPNTVVFVKND